MRLLVSAKWKDDEYICDSGQCVDAKKLCDSKPDWEDGSDANNQPPLYLFYQLFTLTAVFFPFGKGRILR